MMPRILITIIAAGTLLLTSCVKKEYYTVEPPPANQPLQYNYVFDDNFDNNINNWAFSDHSNAAFVSIGASLLKYTYLPANEGSNTVAINTGAKIHRNFLIQTSIKSDNAMGLCFGVSDYDYGYSFFIDNQGYFALYKEGAAGEGVQTIIDWTSNSAVNIGGWNDIEMEQVGNLWYGYINGVKVFEERAEYMTGSKIGYIVLDGTRGFADYLTVRW